MFITPSYILSILLGIRRTNFTWDSRWTDRLFMVLFDMRSYAHLWFKSFFTIVALNQKSIDVFLHMFLYMSFICGSVRTFIAHPSLFNFCHQLRNSFLIILLIKHSILPCRLFFHIFIYFHHFKSIIKIKVFYFLWIFFLLVWNGVPSILN